MSGARARPPASSLGCACNVFSPGVAPPVHSDGATATYSVRATPLTRKDGVLQSSLAVKEDGSFLSRMCVQYCCITEGDKTAEFEKLLSQNWFTPLLTQVAFSISLLMATTQAQFNYCVDLLESESEHLMFVWVWSLAMVVWLAIACHLTFEETKKDNLSGDFAFAPLREVQGCWPKALLLLQHGQIVMSLFFLNLMNVPQDLKYIIMRVHPAGMINKRIYGADSIPMSFTFDSGAVHRYVVVKYDNKVVHDFEDGEAAMVLWPLHWLSIALLYVNYNGQRQSFSETSSLVLTLLSLLLKLHGVYQYFRLRSAYIQYFQEQEKSREPNTRKIASRKLGQFWCVARKKAPKNTELLASLLDGNPPDETTGGNLASEKETNGSKRPALHKTTGGNRPLLHKS